VKVLYVFISISKTDAAVMRRSVGSAYYFFLVLGNGKAQTLVAKVELSVISTQEHVTHNPQRTIRSRNIQSYEAADALHLRTNTNLKDVLGRSEDEGLGSGGGGDHDLEVGQVGDGGAIQGRLAVGARNKGTDDVQKGDDLRLRGIVSQNLINQVDQKLAEVAAAAGAQADVGADLLGLESLQDVLDDLRSILLYNLVALVGEDTSGTNLLVNLLDDGRRTSQEGGTSIGNSLASALSTVAIMSTTNADVADTELPVAGGSVNGSEGESPV